MSRWLDKFLQKKVRNDTDSTDSLKEVSVLSVPSGGILEKNLGNISKIRTDSTDSLRKVSVLSVPSGGILEKNLGNISKIRTDSTDRFTTKSNISPFSLFSQWL